MAAQRVLALLGGIAALYFASSVFIPFVLGVFLYILLDPLVEWAERLKVSRTLSSIVLVTASVIVLILATAVLYGAFADIAKDVPQYAGKIRGMIHHVEKKAEKLETNTSTIIPAPKPKGDVQKVQVVEPRGNVTGYLLRGLGTIAEALAAAIFVPLIALFLLLDKPDLHRTLYNVVSKNYDVAKIDADTRRMVKGFFMGNMIIGFGMAALLGFLYSVLGLKNAVALGLATGFLNLIPFLGPLLSLAFPLSAGLLQFSTPTPFIEISIAVIVLHLVVANIVVPKVVGSHINVNAFAATVGLLFWGWIWGAIGLLIGIPLVAMIKIILEARESTREYSHFLSERPKPERQSFLKQLLTRRVENLQAAPR